MTWVAAFLWAALGILATAAAFAVIAYAAYSRGVAHGEEAALEAINKAFLDMQVKMRQAQVSSVEWQEPEARAPDFTPWTQPQPQDPKGRKHEQ